MRRYLYRGSKKTNQKKIIIIMLFGFFLIGLFSLSLSGKVAQAKDKIGAYIISKLYSDIMEASSTISYQSNKDNQDYPFPINMASGICEIHKSLSDRSEMPDNTYLLAKETFSDSSNNNKSSNISFKINGKGILTREYILTNGAILNEEDLIKHNIEANANMNKRVQELPVNIMEGSIDYSEFGLGAEGNVIKSLKTYNGTPFTLDQLKDTNFLIRHFYINPTGVDLSEELFNADLLLGKDMTIKTTNDEPQILIYHTHSQEAFVGSRPGVLEDTVVGMGDLLTDILEKQYGYNVIHDRGIYDLKDGLLDRDLAYNYARDAILKILDENPSIEVVIDLHRDGNNKRSITLNGEETAQIMLFNGLSYNQKGPIARLDNPNLQDNLAFSLQLQLKSLEIYPGFFYRNYLEVYRYNLDVRPKSILVELGTHENSLQSAKNAMEPFAKVLDAVLKGQ